MTVAKAIKIVCIFDIACIPILVVLIAGSIGVFQTVKEIKNINLLDVFVYIYFAIDILKGIVASFSLYWVL